MTNYENFPKHRKNGIVIKFKEYQYSWSENNARLECVGHVAERYVGGIQLPSAHYGQGVVARAFQIRQTEYGKGGHSIEREAVFHLVCHQNGVPLLKLVKHRGALGNQFQQAYQYDGQQLHLLANNAISPLT